MGFFTLLLSINKKTAQASAGTEFSNANCKCVQQELILSETTWMDTTPYENAKKVLKVKSRELMVSRYESDNQKDLFGPPYSSS